MASTVRLFTTSLLWLVATQFALAQSIDSEIVRSGALANDAVVAANVHESSIASASSPNIHGPGTAFASKARESLPLAKQMGQDVKPLPLSARSKSAKAGGERAAIAKPAESLITMGGSLCVVLSLFFGAAWLLRKGTPRTVSRLPTEIVEVLGKMPLVKGQDMQLVRIGAKLLLICITPHGCETLTEITDEAEVDRLAAVCRRSNPNSVTVAFNQVLHAVGREPASGFAGNVRTASNAVASDRRGARYHA